MTYTVVLMKENGKQQYDQTKSNILKAVGNIIRTEGYTGLFIRNIARKANTSGKMIYYHFGTLDNLVETFIKEKDYWRVFSSDMDRKPPSTLEQDPKSLIKEILQTHFSEFEKHEEMQKVIIWEISQYSEILRKEADLREDFGEKVFAFIEPAFINSDLDFRALTAIIVASIYYLVLHAKSNGSLFCGLDIDVPTDRERILKTIDKLIDICYERANINKEKQA